MTSTELATVTAYKNPRVAAKVCPSSTEVVLRAGVFGAVVALGALVTAHDLRRDYDHARGPYANRTFSTKTQDQRAAHGEATDNLKRAYTMESRNHTVR